MSVVSAPIKYISVTTSGIYPALFSLQGNLSTSTIGGCPQVGMIRRDEAIFDIISELQLRRPNKERYRLDRLLERKAKEGVKICIIV